MLKLRGRPVIDGCFMQARADGRRRRRRRADIAAASDDKYAAGTPTACVQPVATGDGDAEDGVAEGGGTGVGSSLGRGLRGMVEPTNSCGRHECVLYDVN